MQPYDYTIEENLIALIRSHAVINKQGLGQEQHQEQASFWWNWFELSCNIEVYDRRDGRDESVVAATSLKNLLVSLTLHHATRSEMPLLMWHQVGEGSWNRRTRIAVCDSRPQMWRKRHAIFSSSFCDQRIECGSIQVATFGVHLEW